MSHFFLLWDKDEQRRQRVRSAILDDLATIEHLSPRSWETGDTLVMQALFPSAPQSQHCTPTSLACLLGTAADARGNALHARDLPTLWNEPTRLMPAGFHLGICVTAHQGVYVGGDCNGSWPIWYWQRDHLLMVGSSVHLFRHHPEFHARLQPAGLAQVLWTQTSGGALTLWEGVRRLEARHLLVCRQQLGRINVEEAPQDITPHVDSCLADLGPRVAPAAMNCADGALFMDDVTAWSFQFALRNVDEVAWLASGGRDTRLIGGHLRQLGVRMRSYSFGEADDYDVQCARLLANRLGIAWQRVPDSPLRMADDLRALLSWDSMANGFHLLRGARFSSYDLPAELPRFAVTGFGFDGHVLNTVTMDRLIPGGLRQRINVLLGKQWSPADQDARSLFAGHLGAAVHEAVMSYHTQLVVKSGYTSPIAEALALRQLTRVRFFLGSLQWGLSQRTWPVSPVFNPAWQQLSLLVDPNIHRDRYGQVRVLTQRYPDLMELPFALHSAFPQPLMKPPLWRRLLHPRNGICRQKSWRYERLFDVNMPDWVQARRAADVMRERLPGWINRAAFDRLLRGPDTVVDSRGDVFHHMALTRNLIGFLHLLDSPLGRQALGADANARAA